MSEEIVDRVYDISFIGAGQGGGRIAESFYRRGYRKVLALNTAPQDLKRLDIPDDHKYLMHSERQGAGKNPRVSEALTRQHKDKIKALMSDLVGECDRILICVGGGGGTGTGSCGPLIEIAKEYMASLGFKNPSLKVGVICSLPTDGEARSPIVGKNAREVVNLVSTLGQQKKISPVILVDNNKIRKTFPGLTMRNFWNVSNDSIARSFDSFNTLPCLDSPFASFDPADYESVMEAGGFMTMGMAKLDAGVTCSDFVDAFNRSQKDSIVCDTYAMNTATASACIVACSSDVIDQELGLMDEIESALDKIGETIKSDYIHRGVYETDDDGITLYTIAGGLLAPPNLILRIKTLSSG